VGRTFGSLATAMALADHPHARGENAFDRVCEPGISGPSPRTWGERTPFPRSPPRSRTIPTHVGRTAQLFVRQGLQTDHPHARGENWSGISLYGWLVGPSPRTWGERYMTGFTRVRPRTIPTHVGRTRSAHRKTVESPDHPHARGENGPGGLCPSGLFGPSPRTWGEPPGTLQIRCD